MSQIILPYGVKRPEPKPEPKKPMTLAEAQKNLLESSSALEQFVISRALSDQQRESLRQIVHGLTALALEATAMLARPTGSPAQRVQAKAAAKRRKAKKEKEKEKAA